MQFTGWHRLTLVEWLHRHENNYLDSTKAYLCWLVQYADIVTKLKRGAEDDDERHKHKVDVESLTSFIINHSTYVGHSAFHLGINDSRLMKSFCLTETSYEEDFLRALGNTKWTFTYFFQQLTYISTFSDLWKVLKLINSQIDNFKFKSQIQWTDVTESQLFRTFETIIKIVNNHDFATNKNRSR